MLHLLIYPKQPILKIKNKNITCYSFKTYTFVLISTDEVSKLISELNTKSCENDAFPTHLFKAYLHDILPNVTKLVNLSLQQGVFPDRCRE